MSSKKRIQGVLRVRQIQEEIARAELAVANQATRQAETDESTWRGNVAAWSQQSAPSQAALWLSWQRQLSAAGDALTAREHTTEAKRTEAAASHVLWSHAAQRVDGLERLVGRLTEREREVSLAADQALVDDVVSARSTMQARVQR